MLSPVRQAVSMLHITFTNMPRFSFVCFSTPAPCPAGHCMAVHGISRGIRLLLGGVIVTEVPWPGRDSMGRRG